jgi:hypothetical protein
MHPCLEVQEILANIISHIELKHEDGEPEAATGWHDVLNLALTCKAFLEPALDGLWHTQPSLFSLLQTLPEDAFYVEKRPSGNWSLPTIVRNHSLHPYGTILFISTYRSRLSIDLYGPQITQEYTTTQVEYALWNP